MNKQTVGKTVEVRVRIPERLHALFVESCKVEGLTAEGKLVEEVVSDVILALGENRSMRIRAGFGDAPEHEYEPVVRAWAKGRELAGLPA